MRRPWTVLTPHPGEFARLFSLPNSPRDACARLDQVRARVTGMAILVLKGAQTLVGGGGEGSVWVNPTGHPGLSTGGTGDFLAGMVAARAARAWKRGAGKPEDLKHAAGEAVWLHGAAADRLGLGPLVVRDLGASLSALLKEAHGFGRE